MGVVLDEAGRGDLHEGGVAPELLEIGGVEVAHGALDTPEQLVQHLGDLALVGDEPFHPLGGPMLEVLVVQFVAMAFRPALHCLPRGHPADALDKPLGRVLHLAGALLRAGEQAADHDGVGPGGEGFGDVARGADAAVGNDRHAVGTLDRIVDGGQLRNPHPGHQPGRTHTARADPHLDGVGTRGGQIGGAGRRGDVAGHQIDVAEGVLEPLDPFNGVDGMTVGDVEHQCVGARGDATLGTLEHVVVGADGHADQQMLSGQLDLLDLEGMSESRKEAVDDADPAQTRQRDRHLGLADGVHVGRDDGQVELDAPRESGPQAHLAPRAHPRAARHQQHVVVGQSCTHVVQRHAGTSTNAVRGFSRWAGALRIAPASRCPQSVTAPERSEISEGPTRPRR